MTLSDGLQMTKELDKKDNLWLQRVGINGKPSYEDEQSEEHLQVLL